MSSTSLCSPATQAIAAIQKDMSAVRAEEALTALLEEERGPHSLTVAFNSAISAAAKCSDGTAAMAERIFGRMKQEEVAPTTVTYHSLLDAHAHAEGGSARRAVELLNEMLERRLKIERSTFTMVINMQGRLVDGSAKTALGLLALMPKADLCPNTIVVNTAIDAQAKAPDGSAKAAIALVETMAASPDLELRPSVVSYTSAIDACGKCADGTVDAAAKLLDDMVVQGIAPNQLTFAVLVAVAARKGTAAAATDVLTRMAELGVAASLVTWNTAIDAQSKREGGTAAAARALFTKMRADPGCRPNIVSYSACIAAEARCQDGSADRAAALFDEALAEGLQPDVVCLTTLLDSLAKRGSSASRAVEILERMRELDFLRPNRVHFNTVLNACATQRPALIDEAERIFKLMQADGLEPSSHTLSALLRAAAFASCPRPDLARRWFEEYAPSVEVNDYVKRALRSALPHAEAAAMLRDASLANSFGADIPDCAELLNAFPTPSSRRSSSRRSSFSWRAATPELPGCSGSSSSGDEREATVTTPPLIRRRSSRAGMQTPGALFAPPSDRAVGAQGRRGSFSERLPRRGSLSGVFAEEAAAAVRDPAAYAKLGATVRRGSLGSIGNTPQRRSSSAQLPCSSSSRLAPPPGLHALGRRPSLKDRVAAIRADTPKASPVAEPPVNVEPPTTPVAATKPSPMLLLTPDFFQANATAAAAPSTPRNTTASPIIRRPSAPDGSLGFVGSRGNQCLAAT